MAFPTVAGTSVGSTGAGANVTSHTINLPGSISAGDLLIAFLAMDGSRSDDDAGWPAGWTEISAEDAPDGINTTAGCALNIAYRIADGSEGASITYTTAAVERGSYWVARITGWHGTTPPEDGGASITGGASNLDGGASLSPSWGSDDTLWIAAIALDSDILPSAAPTNYGNLVTQNDGTTGGAGIGIARRTNAASSENPGTWTNGATVAVALVVAVRPAAGGASTQSLTLGLLDASRAVYAPSLTPKYQLTLGLLDAARTVYAPTLTGKNTLTLGLLDAARAVYAPTLRQAQFVTLGLLDASRAVYAPELTQAGGTQDITLGLLDNGQALYAPTLTPKSTLTLSLLDASRAVYAPSLTPTNTITLGILDAGRAVYAPTLSTVNTITLGLLDAGRTLYAPTVAHDTGAQSVTLGLLDAARAVYSPILTGKYQLTLPLLDNGRAVHAPTLTPKNTLTLSLLDASRAVYAPTLAARYLLTLPLLDAVRAVYDPTLVGGLQFERPGTATVSTSARAGASVSSALRGTPALVTASGGSAVASTARGTPTLSTSSATATLTEEP